jgi:type II secretory pathway pseudopilin PulG
MTSAAERSERALLRHHDHHLDHEAGDDRERNEPDRGATLVEVLVSVVLLGMVVSSILPAMWAAIRVSRVSDEQARVEAVLGSAVDRVSNYGWHPCPEADAAGGYESKARNAAAIFDWPASTVDIVRIQYWDTSTRTWSDTNPVPDGDCTRTVIAITKERTLQKVTIRVTSPSGDDSNQVDVVVGDIRNDEERDATPA